MSSDWIQPIDASRRREVERETRHYVERASVLLDFAFKPVPVVFDLRGSIAGMFRAEGQRRWIRYNPWIFARHYRENLTNTVPHEVAHYVVHELYRPGQVKPHGPQWRAVMAAFGAEPRVTFDLDLEGVPRRRQQRHSYRCQCGVHAVSTTRHNRVQQGRGVYRCRHCRAQLVYEG
jgi:SprT protein